MSDTPSDQLIDFRLKQAHDTGADVMVTTCPKCYIHITCTMKDSTTGDNEKITVNDLTVLMGQALKD